MTREDKEYYSEPYYPLFKLMSDEFGLTLLEQDLSEIMNCVRKMDVARKEPASFNRSISSANNGLASIQHHSTSSVVTIYMQQNGDNQEQEISLDINELEDLMCLFDKIKQEGGE